jgi:hypothetical protein
MSTFPGALINSKNTTLTSTGIRNVGEKRKTMKIFQAIQKAETVKQFYEKTQIKLNCLIAFNFLGKQTDRLTKDYRGMMDSLYLESGGYAVRNGRAKVSLAEYLEFLKRHGHLFDRFTSFDDKHNDLSHNFSNLTYLKKNLSDISNRLIPVLHEPEDYFQEIKRLSDHGFDYVAIGTPRKIQDRVFEQTKKELPGMKIHLLGKLNRQILTKHQPHSADASSWLRAAVYGTIYYWHPEEKREYRIYVGDKGKKAGNTFHISKFQHKERLDGFLREVFKYSDQDMVDSVEARGMVNLYFYKQLEDHITGYSGSRKCPLSPC